jgi:hypothetical protein
MAALDDRQGGWPVPIFFRADDIGVPSSACTAMLSLFIRHRMPLALAVVPTWLTRQRWDMLCEAGSAGQDLWCWHQHGWRHVNHEPVGKKAEFGASRAAAAIRHDLLRGKQRLEDIIGEPFFRCFTPPWNRCCATTIELLADSGYTAVSRSRGATPDTGKALAEISVNVDLHTRKEPTAAARLAGIAGDLEIALQNGIIGIMLHHQRMSAGDLALLDLLLGLIAEQPGLRPVSLTDLASPATR